MKSIVLNVEILFERFKQILLTVVNRSHRIRSCWIVTHRNRSCFTNVVIGTGLSRSPRLWARSVAMRYDLIRLITIYKLIVLIVDKFWTVQKSSTFSHDWPHDLLRSVTICYDLLRSDTFTTIRPRLRPRCNDCGTWTWHIVTQSQQIATNRSGTYWLVTHRIQTWNFYKSSTISYDWLIVAYVTNRTTVGT